MQQLKKEHPKEKSNIHPRNKHRERYDFAVLSASYPELGEFVRPNKYGDDSIDFSNPEAVKSLNKALLKHFYQISSWNVPAGYLCPPIPGRADYIHHIADVLASVNEGVIPTGERIRCLDIGVGASCIYPVIGNSEYGWSFVGSDTDAVSIESAGNIVTENSKLGRKVVLRQQNNSQDYFNGIIQEKERFDMSICNPPFHASIADAQAGSLRKVKNLKGHKGRKLQKAVLNFGGQASELCCEGGEIRFVGDMILQSRKFSSSCFWFSSLVSKQSNLDRIEMVLKKAKVAESKIVEMGQGNKTSRIVVWTFLDKNQQTQWKTDRWI